MALISTSSFSFKSYEQKYARYERSPFASVSMSALNYQATDRILSLAKPKIRRETTIRDGKKQIINQIFFKLKFNSRFFALYK